MKKIILLAAITAFSAQFSFAQFTGTSPALLTGRAHIYGSGLGNTGVGLNPRTLTLERSFSGVLSPWATFEDNSVGMRFVHKTIQGGSLSEWDVASTGGALHMRYATANLNVLSTTKLGKVGIRTSTPDATFHVKKIGANTVDSHLEGFTLIDGSQASLLLGTTTGAPYGEFGMEYSNSGAIRGLNFWRPSGSSGFANYLLFISDDGLVSIGTDDAKGYNLAVKGKKGIIAEEVTVKLHANWPDFVFKKDYGLMSLSEVETYITENSHLPNVPSEKEIQEDGIKLGEMDAVLLRKIEELTLYVIDLKKEIDELKK